MYSILSVNNTTTPLDLTGVTTGTTFTIELDRDLPNYNSYVVDAFIYPGRETIKDYYDNPTPVAYWNGGLLDFTTNCTLSNDDVPVWNMSIVTIEDFIGLDSSFYKGKYNANSKNYWGTAINYDYFLDNLLNKVGLIHYTNNSISNFYGEGFYKNTFKLKIPYLMWHKKQFGGAGYRNADSTAWYTADVDSPEADYGRSSFENRPNERTATSERTVTLNSVPAETGQVSVHYLDDARPTRRCRRAGRAKRPRPQARPIRSACAAAPLGWGRSAQRAAPSRSSMAAAKRTCPPSRVS
jgi:hypothetical protein